MGKEVEVWKLEATTGVHTIVQMPANIDIKAGMQHSSDILNIVMIDVSGSMSGCWNDLYQNWNKYLSGTINGRTRLYVFGTEVVYLRSAPHVEKGDFLSSYTNLSGALSTVQTELTCATESHIRVFLCTDGNHYLLDDEVQEGECVADPEVVINGMSSCDKHVEVFLLGIGESFPVKYSISMRSKLHTGSSNFPTLFWAKDYEEIEIQMMNMAEKVKEEHIKLSLSLPGQLVPSFQNVPFLPEMNAAHLGESVFYLQTPEEVLGKLIVQFEDTGIKVSPEIYVPPLTTLIDKVFRQWTSVLIQRHHRKESVPMDVFDFMEDIFRRMYSDLLAKNEAKSQDPSVASRLLRKEQKGLQVDFQTLLNQSKNLILLEEQYSNEIQLAEAILKTTVKSKHDAKNLKMKGHGLDEFVKDVEAFRKQYEKAKPDILALGEPDFDDCCSVTFTSTLKDLQDPDFLDLLELDKFSFLKTFSVTGIPIYSHVRDSSQINPWTLIIKRVLSSPYTCISHTVLESSAEAGTMLLSSADKDVCLQEDDPNSQFNAVVAVFSQRVANVLKPLICSNLFALCNTFAILKNPHIRDHNAHIAALACLLVKTVTDYPEGNHPEYVVNRLDKLRATASLYLNRKELKTYSNALFAKPSEAQMTESLETFDNCVTKCESLTKPLMFLLLCKENPDVRTKIESVFPWLVMECIGRCLGSYTSKTPFTGFLPLTGQNLT